MFCLPKTGLGVIGVVACNNINIFFVVGKKRGYTVFSYYNFNFRVSLNSKIRKNILYFILFVITIRYFTVWNVPMLYFITESEIRDFKV